MNPRRVRRVERPVLYGRQQLPGRRNGWRQPAPRQLLGLLPRRLVIMSVAGVVLTVALGQIFAIKNVNVEAPNGRSAEVEREARKLLARGWRQQNILTFDATAMEEGLLQADPMIKTVVVRRQWPNALKLTATLKQPALGWMTGDQAYLLDRDGSAIGTLPAGSTLPAVIDGSNLPVKLGQHVTSSRFIVFMTELAPVLVRLGLAPSRYEVKETTLDLYVTTNRNYRLILDTSRPAGEQVADLQTLLGFLARQGKAPVEYIDLRITGKAYYK